jgi:hypothetical protein
MPARRLAPVRFLLLAAPAVVSVVLAAPASARIFGTTPIPISVTGSGGGGDGPSGGATISGDNRKGRLAAFHSEASNLVAGDTNGVADVFLFSRPRGARGTTRMDAGPARPAGGLRRVSVPSGGGQANGPSSNPSLDGRLRLGDRDVRAHCVAFQSEASNLVRGDRDRTSDVFVRDLRRDRTILISRGIAAAATNPSIDGDCDRVGFEAGGRAYLAGVAGRVRSLGAGAEVDLALDGRAVVWRSGGVVKLRREGRTSVVGPGSNPTVSDREHVDGRLVWAVSFQTRSSLAGRDRNPGLDVYTRTFAARGGSLRTDLISATRRGGSSLGGDSENGGLTAYAAGRGIVVFVNHRARGSTLFYRNNNSGNIDDLAHTGDRAIFDVATSARANWVAFTSAAASFAHDRNGGVPDVFLKHLVDGHAL